MTFTEGDRYDPTATDGSSLEFEVEPVSLGNVRAVLLTLTCTLAMIVNMASISSASIALPSTGDSLDIAEDELQWIISAYSLSSGCLLILFGRFADLYGPRKVFVLGCFILFVFALGCGFAQDQITIDILRGFQGIGGAAVVPASLGILARAFPPSRARSVAFATFSAGAPLGGGIGLCLGGALTQVTDAAWRSTYYLCAGLAALAGTSALCVVPSDRPSTENDRRVDWLGAFLVTAGLVLIVFVLADGETAPKQWSTPYIIALLVIGVIFIALFIAWQHYLERVQDEGRAYSWCTPPPLMKLSLWARGHGRFAVMVCIVFCLMGGFQTWSFWALLYYQDYEMLNPVRTMLRMVPMIFTGLSCNAIIAFVIGRLDVAILLVFGCICTSLATLLFAIIDPTAVYWAYGFPASILSVFGADFVFAAGTLFIAKISLPHEQSLAGATFQTMNQLGTSFALSISTIVFDRVRAREAVKLGVIVDESGNAPLSAQLTAYKAAQWTGFALLVFAGILAAIFLRGVGIVGHPHPSREDDVVEEDPEKKTSVSSMKVE